MTASARALPGMDNGQIYVGPHLSTSRGFDKTAETAEEIGATAFQFFPRNPRGSQRRDIPDSEIDDWFAAREEHGVGPIVAHIPYTVNLCTQKDSTRDFAIRCVREDLERTHRLGGQAVVLHPGSHTGQGVENGIRKIVDALEQVLTDFTPADNGHPMPKILLETMSGRGTEVGGHPKELQAIIEAAGGPEQLGVCVDACHVFAAGYDIRTDDGMDQLITDLDASVGLERVQLAHLNDSKQPLGSNKDNHAPLGDGEIGEDGLRRFVSHPGLRELPFLLETPAEDVSEWGDECDMVRSFLG